MKTLFSCLLILALAAAPVVRAAEGSDLPAPFPAERYGTMKASSPFALATAPVVVKEEPNFAGDLFITGATRIGGKDIISVTKKDKSKSFTLVSGGPPVEGMSILSVNWSPEVGKTTVEIKNGGDTGTLQFNEYAIQTPVAPTALPPVQPGQPGRVVPVNPAGLPPPRVLNTPATGVDGTRPRRRIIRRPSS